MRCRLCHKLHGRSSHVARTSSNHRSVASYSPKIAICAYPVCIPVGILPWRLACKN